jgi:basic membrane lipoprotein Med (substrate-binding protein (PBP1-ABC) superfamily)
MKNDQFTIEMAKEFHQKMATIIDAVQEGIWQKGVRDLLGYSTDYGLGQKHGLQTLILKTGHKSAYVRLHWDNIFGSSSEDKALVTNSVQKAIQELC